MYFKKINEKYQDESFGADALINNVPRNATIKTMSDGPVHFATLNRANYRQSLQKIDVKKTSKTIEFLQNIPCFKSQTRKAIMRYTHFLKPIKFVRGQTVYAEGQVANSVYIVYKGEFELGKKLPKTDRLSDNANVNALNAQSGSSSQK